MLILAVSAEEASVNSCVDSLGKLFAIVLALAIGEAFKQFVSDQPGSQNRKIHWNRLWALVAFLALVVPFFHGISRYYFETYQAGHRPSPYWKYLIVDTIGFTVEAVLFFVLSRSLDPKDWRKFYVTVLVLLVIDIAWGSWVALKVNPDMWSWVRVNAAAVVLLSIFVVLGSKWKIDNVAWSANTIAVIGVVILILRTLGDYYFSFSFYFPTQ